MSCGRRCRVPDCSQCRSIGRPHGALNKHSGSWNRSAPPTTSQLSVGGSTDAAPLSAPYTRAISRLGSSAMLSMNTVGKWKLRSQPAYCWSNSSSQCKHGKPALCAGHSAYCWPAASQTPQGQSTTRPQRSKLCQGRWRQSPHLAGTCALLFGSLVSAR